MSASRLDDKEVALFDSAAPANQSVQLAKHLQQAEDDIVDLQQGGGGMTDEQVAQAVINQQENTDLQAAIGFMAEENLGSIVTTDLIGVQVPPLPKTAANNGQWIPINGSDGAAYTFGGTSDYKWAYFAFKAVTSTGVPDLASFVASVAVGASTLAGESLKSWRGFAWRIFS